MYSNLMYVLYLGKSKPFYGRVENTIALLNELALGIIMHCFVIFTQFCPNEKLQYIIGWVEIFIFFFMLSINMGRQLLVALKPIWLRIVQKYVLLKKKYNDWQKKREDIQK